MSPPTSHLSGKKGQAERSKRVPKAKEWEDILERVDF